MSNFTSHIFACPSGRHFRNRRTSCGVEGSGASLRRIQAKSEWHGPGRFAHRKNAVCPVSRSISHGTCQFWCNEIRDPREFRLTVAASPQALWCDGGLDVGCRKIQRPVNEGRIFGDLLIAGRRHDRRRAGLRVRKLFSGPTVENN